MPSRPYLPHLTILCTLLLVGCGGSKPDHYTGYVEGEYLYLNAAASGRITTLAVTRGQNVAQDALVFTLDPASDAAAVNQAQAQVQAAQAQANNLAEPRRPEEIATLTAQQRSAQASLDLSQDNLKRQTALAKQGFVSPANLDSAQLAVDRDRATLGQINAQLALARASIGRTAERASATANTQAARANQAQRTWQLAQRQTYAPQAALVVDTLRQPGEWVAAGTPVVVLLPPQNRKVRFFVPTADLPPIQLGQVIRIHCDGCDKPASATVSYISPTAEYTPPVIYSKESRAKLVFRIDATIDPKDAQRLPPGLPVDISLEQK